MHPSAIRFTDDLPKSNLLPERHFGLSSFDDPQGLTSGRLDGVRCAVDRVTQRGVKTHLIHASVAAITGTTIACVRAVISTFCVVPIAVLERMTAV